MKTDNKGIIKHFGLVIYPVDFVIVIGEGKKDEVNKLYKPYEEEYSSIASPETPGATYRVKEKETETPCILIWIRNVEDFTTSIVAHECGHAAMEIFSYIGTKPNPDDQEPFCYLLGNLVRLSVGSFYDIPGINPPTVSPERPKKKSSKIKEK